MLLLNAFPALPAGEHVSSTPYILVAVGVVVLIGVIVLTVLDKKGKK